MIKIRERKYRFWDLVEKRMIYPGTNTSPDLLINPKGFIFRSDCCVWDDLSLTEGEFFPMDWLGITDKRKFIK